MIINTQSQKKLTEIKLKNLSTKIEKQTYHKISYSLVVILEYNDVSEVQYKKIMIIGNE